VEKITQFGPCAIRKRQTTYRRLYFRKLVLTRLELIRDRVVAASMCCSQLISLEHLWYQRRE
jgi:hypothetical protein